MYASTGSIENALEIAALITASFGYSAGKIYSYLLGDSSSALLEAFKTAFQKAGVTFSDDFWSAIRKGDVSVKLLDPQYYCELALTGNMTPKARNNSIVQ